MTTNNAMFFEGQSVTRPPMFNGSNYMSWKKVKLYELEEEDDHLLTIY